MQPIRTFSNNDPFVIVYNVIEAREEKDKGNVPVPVFLCDSEDNTSKDLEGDQKRGKCVERIRIKDWDGENTPPLNPSSIEELGVNNLSVFEVAF